MNNIDQLLLEISDKLNEVPCVKEYFRLKQVIENDKELMELDKQVKNHQSKMCQNQNNDKVYFTEKALYEKYLKELERNPVYQNFNEVKKEVNSLLIDMRDFLM